MNAIDHVVVRAVQDDPLGGRPDREALQFPVVGTFQMQRVTAARAAAVEDCCAGSLQDDRRNSGAGSCGDEATRFLSARILHFLAVVRPVLQCNGRTRSGLEKSMLKTGRVSNHDLVSRRTRRWGRTCGNPWTCRGVPTDSAPRCR